MPAPAVAGDPCGAPGGRPAEPLQRAECSRCAGLDRKLRRLEQQLERHEGLLKGLGVTDVGGTPSTRSPDDEVKVCVLPRARSRASTGVFSTGDFVPQPKPDEVPEGPEGLENEDSVDTTLGRSVRFQLEEELEKGAGSPRLGEGVRTLRSLQGFLDLECKHEIKSSIWEAALLIGLPVIGRSNSALTALALVVNILVQITFVLLLVYAPHVFINEDHPNVEEMNRWRLWAHDLKNMVASMSLPTAVCGQYPSLSVAEYQVSVLKEIDTYTRVFYGPFHIGEVLCAMVNLLWFLTVLMELRECASLFTSLRAVREGERTKLDVADESFSFRTMSKSRKLAMLILTGIRSFVAVLLLMFGALWLSRSWKAQELILDCAALAFFMQIDEIIYHTLAPERVRRLISRLDALPYESNCENICNSSKPKRQQKRCDYPLILTWVTGLILVGVMTEMQAFFNIQLMYELQGAMCGNGTDFVYLDHFPLILTAESKPLGEDTKIREMADEAIGAVMGLASRGQFSNASLGAIERESQESLTALFPEACHDAEAARVMPSFDWAGAMHATLEHYADIKFTSCEDVRPYCNIYELELVRFFCPETCGCGSPLSGLRFTTGCPSSCEDRVPETVPCEDPEAITLVASTGWHNFWESSKYTNWAEELHIEGDGIDELVQQRGCPTNISASTLEQEQVRSRYCGFGEHANVHGSLRHFCPISCGCKAHSPDCPPSCRGP